MVVAAVGADASAAVVVVGGEPLVELVVSLESLLAARAVGRAHLMTPDVRM